MNPDELKDRTKKFALRVIKAAQSLPNSDECRVLKRQLVKAGTSVGANYRAACRARSKADFISKITIVEEEADETAFWIEIIIESGFIKKEKLKSLLDEANELTAIFTASGKTSKYGKSEI